MLPELRGYNTILWLDAHALGSSRKINPKLPKIFVSLLEKRAMVVGSHGQRRDARSEVGPAAERAVATTKDKSIRNDTNDAFQAQVKRGFTDSVGLFWCGTFAYRANDLRAQQALQVWWKEIQMYSFRDQISFPYVVQLYGAEIGVDNVTIREKDIKSLL